MPNTKYPRQRNWSPKLRLQAHTNRSSELNRLQKIATSLATIESILHDSLPEKLQGLFQVNSLKQGTLTLTCSRATHKALFLANQADILKHFNVSSKHSQQATEVKIKVKPKIKTREHTRQQAKLSDQTSALLEAEASTTNDENLKRALLNIAKRNEEKQGKK